MRDRRCEESGTTKDKFQYHDLVAPQKVGESGRGNVLEFVDGVHCSSLAEARVGGGVTWRTAGAGARTANAEMISGDLIHRHHPFPGRGMRAAPPGRPAASASLRGLPLRGPEQGSGSPEPGKDDRVHRIRHASAGRRRGRRVRVGDSSVNCPPEADHPLWPPTGGAERPFCPKWNAMAFPPCPNIVPIGVIEGSWSFCGIPRPVARRARELGHSPDGQSVKSARAFPFGRKRVECRAAMIHIPAFWWINIPGRLHEFRACFTRPIRLNTPSIRMERRILPPSGNLPHTYGRSGGPR